MRVILDRAACQGHGRCYSLAPALFEADDEGHAVLTCDRDLRAQELDAARLAVDSCPEFAISLR